MEQVKVIKIEESVFAPNEKLAEKTRTRMKKEGTFFVNVMSGPGAGKTTALTQLINDLKGEFGIGEMDVDIESSLDAQKVADATGIPSMQIHNGGLCHIDAEMTAKALDAYDKGNLDLLILENIGNMVCPAEFDTGAEKNLMLWSITEGDDKPLKYPLMFRISDAVAITKIDTAAYFDFDFARAEAHVKALNPDARIFRISAKTGEGMSELEDWFRQQIREIKEKM